MDSPQDFSRLTDLENVVSHQQKMLDDFHQVLLRQQKEIDRLSKELARAKRETENLRNRVDHGPVDPLEERPPHY